MDSLVATYASSDEEEEEGQKVVTASAPSKPSATSSSKLSSLSLPPPKPSSSTAPSTVRPPRFFPALPPPKSQSPSLNPPISSPLKTHDPNSEDEAEEEKGRKPTKNFSSSTPSKAPSPIFSSLPLPKSQHPKPTDSPSMGPNPKRVVRFTPPLHPSLLKPHDFDDDDRERKPSKDFSSSTSAKSLSSMLPAPKNSLCLAPGPSSAASRRSVVEASIPVVKPGSVTPEQQIHGHENYADVPAANSGGFMPEQEPSGYENYGSYNGSWTGGFVEDGTGGVSGSSFAGGAESSGSVPSYGSDVVYGSYAGSWSDGSVAMTAPEIRDMGRIAGKRGRNGIPTEIVEVKQDELIKNRPREDQVKMTGIAFGPSYQPVSSGKGGKPSKLHKRKHQIGALFYDMKQKEMELAERRSRGFLTKAETQAKYGW